MQNFYQRIATVIKFHNDVVKIQAYYINKSKCYFINIKSLMISMRWSD